MSRSSVSLIFAGDEVLGATIDFEELSKDEVLHVLKLMEPFNDKVKVLTRNNRSKSVGNLTECGGNPEEVRRTHICIGASLHSTAAGFRDLNCNIHNFLIRLLDCLKGS